MLSPLNNWVFKKYRWRTFWSRCIISLHFFPPERLRRVHMCFSFLFFTFHYFLLTCLDQSLRTWWQLSVCVCIFEQLQSSYVTCISVCIGQSVYECVCGCGCVRVCVCVPPSDRPSKSLSQLMSDHSGVLLRALHVIKSGKGAIYAIKWTGC